MTYHHQARQIAHMMGLELIGPRTLERIADYLETVAQAAAARCCKCGRPRMEHTGAELRCLGPFAGATGHQTFDTVALPPRTTCEDCARLAQCRTLTGSRGPERSCDYYPSRFRPNPKQESPCRAT